MQQLTSATAVPPVGALASAYSPEEDVTAAEVSALMEAATRGSPPVHLQVVLQNQFLRVEFDRATGERQWYTIKKTSLTRSQVASVASQTWQAE
jgi:hypothetical protein